MFRLSRRQVLIASAFAPLAAHAARYPDRPIRVIVPYTAGGLAETIMRMLAVSMEARLGQKLVIEAKPGAAGNIGTQEVARADPDGYEILVAATNNFVINQFLLKMSFDPLTALAPIAKVADVPLVLFSNPSVPARTLPEFIAYARAHPSELNYGTPSVGTVNHLLIERLKQTTGIALTHVPYKGSPEALLALLKNDIQLFPIGLSVGLGHLREGKLTALAVAASQRLRMIPGIPTMSEAGFPGTASNWWGMAGPAGTPDDVADTLHKAVAEALTTQPVQARFLEMGMLAPEITRQQFAASLKAEAAMWSETIARGNIKID
ncbi:MAG: tripartite tricarboxylate transporter substrate binding protein [Xanthobacteraceae bacterium]|nr:tripartite tricarboxylate transporter substrate binding protein [Xanthobacteraceae bacterium]